MACHSGGGRNERMVEMTCTACRQLIRADQLVQRVLDQIYHTFCFRCSVCAQPLAVGERFFTQDGHILCTSHVPVTADVLSSSTSPGDSQDSHISAESHLLAMPTRLGTQTAQATDAEKVTTLSTPNQHLSNGSSTSISSLSSDDNCRVGQDGGQTDNITEAKPCPKKRAPRAVIKGRTLEILKATFARNPKPSRQLRERLCKETGLSMRTILVWFQHRRSKERWLRGCQNQWQPLQTASHQQMMGLWDASGHMQGNYGYANYDGDYGCHYNMVASTDFTQTKNSPTWTNDDLYQMQPPYPPYPAQHPTQNQDSAWMGVDGTGGTSAHHIPSTYSQITTPASLHTSAGSSSMPSLNSSQKYSNEEAIRCKQTTGSVQSLHNTHSFSANNVNIASIHPLETTSQCMTSLVSNTSPQQAFTSGSDSYLPEDLLAVAEDLATSHQSLFKENYSFLGGVTLIQSSDGSFPVPIQQTTAYTDSSNTQAQMFPACSNPGYGCNPYTVDFSTKDVFPRNMATETQSLIRHWQGTHVASNFDCVDTANTSATPIATPTLTQLLHSLDSLEQYA